MPTVSVRIGKCLHATPAEIEAKTFNIYVGISLGNKYFTKDRVRAYVQWALEHTMDNVVVLIADDIHAINLEVLKGYSADDARHSARQSGDETVNMVQSIINGLPMEKQSLVHVMRWAEIHSEPDYRKHLKILQEEFLNNREFHQTITAIVKSTFTGEVPTDALAQYILRELPLFLFGMDRNGTFYSLLPYPGLTAIDDVVVGMQDRTLFPEIAERLNLTVKTAFIEAYVE